MKKYQRVISNSKVLVTYLHKQTFIRFVKTLKVLNINFEKINCLE